MKTLFALIVSIFLSGAAFAQDVPSGRPEASVDLMTAEGVKLVAGQWKYSDTRIVETNFNAAGAEGQPTGPQVKTYDYTPHAGVLTIRAGKRSRQAISQSVAGTGGFRSTGIGST
jgi:hypothetical protein